MASAEGGGARKQVPKIHTERAKAAAMQAQVAQDMAEAQLKGQMAMQKARLKAKANMLSFAGSQMDARAQAQADREAMGQPEPVGPSVNVAPLPDSSQPNSGASGAQGLDLNALLTSPGAVQGGAGIQSATGGMGRAEPGGVDPNQLQSQVSPYNVSQSTINRSVPTDVGGQIVNAPQTTQETRVEPNQLTPYQLGKLQQIGQSDTWKNEVKPALDEATDNLASAKRLLAQGLIEKQDYLEIAGATVATLEELGLPTEFFGQINARAAAKQGKIRTEEFKSLPEIQKEMQILKTLPPGYERTQTLRRVEKLAAEDKSEFSGLLPVLLHPAIQRSNREYKRALSGEAQIGILENIIVQPGFAGIESWFSSPLTKTVESVKDVAKLFGGEVQYENAKTNAVSTLDSVAQQSIATATSPEDAARQQQVYGQLRGVLLDPKLLGTWEQTRALLTVSLGSTLLDRATVNGFEQISNTLLNFQGAEPRATSLARLKMMKNDIGQNLKNLESERNAFESLGVRLPKFDYSGYRSGIDIGNEEVVGGGNIADYMNLGK